MEYYGYIDSFGDIHIYGSYSGDPVDPPHINWLKVLLIVVMAISGGGIASTPLPYIMMGDDLIYPLHFFLSMTLPILVIAGLIMAFAITFMRAIIKAEEMASECISITARGYGDSTYAEEARKAIDGGVDKNGNIDFSLIANENIEDPDMREAARLVLERERVLREINGTEVDNENLVDHNYLSSVYLGLKYRNFFSRIGNVSWLTYLATAISIIIDAFVVLEEQNIAFFIPLNVLGILPVLVSAVNTYNKYRTYTSSKGRALGRTLLILLSCYLIVPFLCILFRDLYDLGNSMFLIAFTVADIALKIDVSFMRDRYNAIVEGKKYAPRFFLWRSLILFIAAALAATLVVCGIAIVEPNMLAAILAFDEGDLSYLPMITTYFVTGGLISLAIITVVEFFCNRAWHKKAKAEIDEDEVIIRAAGDVV